MASWFTRALDTITPWDRGGEVQRRREREEEERRQQQSFSPAPNRQAPSLSVAPTQQRQNNITVQEPKPRAPINVFEANKNLVFNKPQNITQVSRTSESTPSERPQPGKIYQPRETQAQRLARLRAEADAANAEVQKYTNMSRWDKLKKFGLGETGTATRDMAVDIPRQIARSGPKVIQEIRDIFNGKEDVKPLDPNKNSFSRFVLGSEPITSSRQEGQEVVGSFTDNETAKKAGGVVNLGFDIADLVGLGTLIKQGFKAPVRYIARKVGKEAAEETAQQAPRQIPVRRVNDVPVRQVSDDGANIPVRNANRPKPIIREVGGDAPVVTPNRAIQERAVQMRQSRANALNEATQPGQRQIDRFEGVTARNFEDITGVTRKSIEEEKIALDEALAKKEINKEQHKAANKELDDMLDSVNTPKGQPIEVKKVDSINVNENVDVPTDLPETPGKVRVTTSKEPNKAKSEAIANESTPVSSSEPVRPDGELADSSVDPTKRADLEDSPTQTATDVPDDISPARRDLIFSLKEANKQSVRDARALSVARGEKAAKATGMAKGLEGEAATRARRAGFRGELGHRGRYVGIGGEDGERIFNELRLEAQRNPELSQRIYTLDNVEEALSRAVRGTDLNGRVVGAPTKRQVELLREYFGEDVGKAVEDAVNISKSFGQSARENIGKAVATPRAMMSSLDLSATIRQGGVLSSRFPKEAAKNAKEQLKYFASDDAFKKGMKEIENRSSYETMVKSGLDITGTKGVGKAEEQFVENFAGKVPIIGRGVEASNRAYTGFLTKLRADVFDKVVNKSLESGVELSQRELDDLAKFINTASGRGDLGRLEDHAKTLSTTLFSPRLWKSRLDMLNPGYYAKLTGPAKKLALQSAASYASIASTVLGLAAAAGLSVETDLRSSDFGKIRDGNKRYDILGGFQQNLVFAWRELTGEKKSSTTGEVTKFARGVPDLIKGRSDEEAGVETGPYTPNRVSVASDLFTNKANPVLGAAGRVLAGKDRGGNPVDPLEELARLSVPLSVSGAWDAANDIGDATNPADFAKGMLINSPDLIGISSQVYGQVPTKDQNYDKYAEAKDKAAALRDNGALTDSKDINEAMDNKDYSSAITGYEYQRAMAEADPDTTEKQLASIDRNIKEATYLSNGVPKTDDGILAQAEENNYDKAIEGLRWKMERSQEDGEMSEKSRKEIETDITRFEVAKDNELPYQDIKDYQDVNLTEWRKMGIPPGDDKHDPDLYDPDMYQKLYEIDQMMTKAGVSYKRGDLKKNKYYLKESKSGSGRGGRGGSRSFKTSFGTLSDSGRLVPQVRAYQSIDAQTGSIPVIRTVRPNIRHKITSSG